MVRSLFATRPGPAVIAAVLAAAVLAGLVIAAGINRFGATSPAAGEPATAGTAEVAVDARLRPSVAYVEPIDGQPRPVGALAHPGGLVEEMVLDEVMLYARDPSERDAFLARYGGTVVDEFPPDESGGQDLLVRVDLDRVAAVRVDGGQAVATWGLEPGQHRISDEQVARLLSLVATEAAAGLAVDVSALITPQGIENGQARESADVTGRNPAEPVNAFDWSYLREGGPLDTGVARAWQVLAGEKRLTRQITFMVVDGGFARNDDFPPDTKLRKGSWGDSNNRDCGEPCPWHGTHVALAGIATVDNRYGVAGPGGPVTSTLVAVQQGLDYWTTMRRTVDMAREERPDIVNLSIQRVKTGDARHARDWTDRRMKQVRDTGALVVAAAGNLGVAIDAATHPAYLPCESEHVMCVGGVASDATVDADSNRSRGFGHHLVELYGPMCVLSLANPPQASTDARTAWICGTSFATPFVGGVAALVLAANPELSADQVRDLLRQTAHNDLDEQGVIRVRRINALAAVTQALAKPPVVTIEAPAAGSEHSVGQWVDLRGTATDVLGNPVPITWHSDRTGKLAEGAQTSTLPLPAGRHVITASATDARGETGSASVTIEVVDAPPQVHIVSPPAQAPPILAGSPLELEATSYDPDTFAPVPEDQALWYVWRDGQAVHVGQGHTTTLSADLVTPGSYRARFLGGVSQTERTFEVSPLPPGQVPPTATITAPAGPQVRHALHGNPVPLTFTGAGTDQHGNAVPGTRYRWVAHGVAEQKVLCQGSLVPGAAAPGGFAAAPRDCASFQAQLGVESGWAETTWRVWLEVYYGDDPVTTSVSVKVLLLVS